MPVAKDLADQESYEIAVIEAYMPEALPAEELDALIDATIAETGASSMRDMGKVMGLLKSQVQGRADLGAVSSTVKQKARGLTLPCSCALAPSGGDRAISLTPALSRRGDRAISLTPALSRGAGEGEDCGRLTSSFAALTTVFQGGETEVAGLIPRQFIDDLLSRVDIVDVVDEYVPLKKGGKDHKACCPFHNEKSPSFTVSADKQFYHCFGCGAHGSAISFLMEYAHMDFVEAVEDLASRAGLEVPREAGGEERGESLQPIYDILAKANAYFQQQLRQHPRAAQAVDYLRNRGLSGEIAAAFGMGFAPPGWDNMLNAIGRSDSDRTLMSRAGLLVDKGGGGFYDRFRDRITFPILDRRGRTVGFGGRVLGDETPKYLNSPETPCTTRDASSTASIRRARQPANPSG